MIEVKGYIEEFHNMPYYTNNNNERVIQLSQLFRLINELVDVFTALDFAFVLGMMLRHKSYYVANLDQKKQKYYIYDDIKDILQNNFDGSYSLWSRLTTGNEEINYDNLS